MLQPHLLQVGLQFLGDQHRDCGVVALAHLDIGHGQEDLAAAVNPNEGVRRKTAGLSSLGFTVGERQPQAQHQAAAGRRSRLEDPAPGKIFCRKGFWIDGVGRDTIDNHCQPSLPVDCDASLIASRMRT
jgi:hypothetical protein